MKNLISSIREFFRTEAEKLKPLPMKQRLEYIWEYYRFIILAALFVIIVATCVIRTVVEAKTSGEVIFGIAVVNDVYDNKPFEKALSAELNEVYDVAAGEEQVLVNTDYTISNTGLDQYESITSLLVIIDAGLGKVDVIVGGEDVANYFSEASEFAWVDLRTFLSEDFLSEYADRVYTVEYQGETIPVGLILTDTRFTDSDMLARPNPIAFFPQAAVHQDKWETFATWAMGTIE